MIASRVERHRAAEIDRAISQIEGGMDLRAALSQLYTAGASWGEQDAATELRGEFEAERENYARREREYW